MARPEFLVFGGDMTGTMAAISLAEAGTSVTLHDSGRHTDGQANCGCGCLGRVSFGGGVRVAIPTKAEPLHMNITESGAPQINQLVQHAERSIALKQFGSGQIMIGGGWPAMDRGGLGDHGDRRRRLAYPRADCRADGGSDSTQ